MLNKRFISFASIFALLAVLVGAPPFFARADVSSAVTYLGGRSGDPWVTMALSADGQLPDVSYLQGFSSDKAIELEAPILALAAAGKDPRAFTGSDLVAALQSHVSGGQIGDASILNDDIFGILALSAAGVSAADVSVSGPRQFLLSHQNSDGGWSFSVGGASDTNTTAAAVMALLDTGSAVGDAAVANAVAYLRSAQNNDGGFPYDPKSPYGTGSDASSDSWVISALSAAGISPQSLTKPGGDPVSNLLSLQAGSGYFRFQADSSEDGFSGVTTAYAVIALLGKSYPVGRIDAPGPQAPTAGFRIVGSTGEICAGNVAAATALDVIRNAEAQCGYTYHIKDTAYGPYLDQIGNDTATGSIGWVYFVNDVSPSTGAADYALKSGDSVIWAYGNGDLPPEGDSASLSLSANIVAATSSTSTVAFSVEASGQSAVDFGTVLAGTSVTKTFSVRNQGQVPITVTGSVSGDSVFRDYILIDSAPWNSYHAPLAIGEILSSDVAFAVPAGYSGSGKKSGTLMFWATVTQ